MRTFARGARMCHNPRCRHRVRIKHAPHADFLVPEPNKDLVDIEREFLYEARMPHTRSEPPLNRTLAKGSGKQPTPGFIYSVQYQNFHNDKNPMLFVLAANQFDVWGINIGYLKKRQIKKLQELIQAIRNNVQAEKNFNSPKQFYHNFLKHKYKDLIEIAFRRYKTRWFYGVPVQGGLYNYLERKAPKMVSSKYLDKKLRDNVSYSTQYGHMLSYRDKLESLKRKMGIKGLTYRR